MSASGLWGHEPSNKALTLWHVGVGQVVGVPRVAGCICFGERPGNHTPSLGAELRQGDRLWGPVQECRECGDVR